MNTVDEFAVMVFSIAGLWLLLGTPSIVAFVFPGMASRSIDYHATSSRTLKEIDDTAG